MTVTQLDKDRILEVHNQTAEVIKKGNGPFFARVYDKDGNIVADRKSVV